MNFFSRIINDARPVATRGPAPFRDTPPPDAVESGESRTDGIDVAELPRPEAIGKPFTDAVPAKTAGVAQHPAVMAEGAAILPDTVVQSPQSMPGGMKSAQYGADDVGQPAASASVPPAADVAPDQRASSSTEVRRAEAFPAAPDRAVPAAPAPAESQPLPAAPEHVTKTPSVGMLSDPAPPAAPRPATVPDDRTGRSAEPAAAAPPRPASALTPPDHTDVASPQALPRVPEHAIEPVADDSGTKPMPQAIPARETVQERVHGFPAQRYDWMEPARVPTVQIGRIDIVIMAPEAPRPAPAPPEPNDLASRLYLRRL